MAKYKHNINGVEVDFTPEEEAIKDAEAKAWNDAKADRKLAEIKSIRLEKLIETDYLANSDVTMPDNVKTWRQTLRDIPANHTDEAAYDALLAKDADGNLTNSVWSKP
jgi:phosphoribosylformylglycinamidine (FGAM) synthase PurS component